MNEKFPVPEREVMTKAEHVQLAKELSERHEAFPFQGLDDGVYEKLKAVDEEYPGFTTPIDALIPRLETHGMKVALGSHPESGNVFILPLDSNDIENDSIIPWHLKVTDGMDSDLKKLILYSKAGKK